MGEGRGERGLEQGITGFSRENYSTPENHAELEDLLKAMRSTTVR